MLKVGNQTYFPVCQAALSYLRVILVLFLIVCLLVGVLYSHFEYECIEILFLGEKIKLLVKGQRFLCLAFLEFQFVREFFKRQIQKKRFC